MAGTLVQFRMDEELRDEALKACEELGVTLPDFLRTCTTYLADGHGAFYSWLIGFRLNPLMQALREASRQAEEAGTSEMTLEEINAEIKAVRAERRARREAEAKVG